MNRQVDAAENFAVLISKMVERYKHDDGSSQPTESHATTYPTPNDPDELAIFQELRDLIDFRNDTDIARFNPTRREYWQGPIDVHAIHMGNNCMEKEPSFPTDMGEMGCHASSRDQSEKERTVLAEPVDDDEFYRLQERICAPLDHTVLMEDSLMRCDASDHDSHAEDIASDGEPDELLIEALNTPSIDQTVHFEKSAEVASNSRESGPLMISVENLMVQVNESGSSATTTTTICASRSKRLTKSKSAATLSPDGGNGVLQSSVGADDKKNNKTNRDLTEQESIVDDYHKFNPHLSSTFHEPKEKLSIRKFPMEKDGLTPAQKRLQQLKIVIPSLTNEQRSQRRALFASLGDDISQVSKRRGRSIRLCDTTRWEKASDRPNGQ